MTSLKAVLFDFDGVLADSMATHLKAWELAHEDIYGKKIESHEINRLRGKSTNWISEYLCKKNHNYYHMERLIKSKSKHLLELALEVKLLMGVHEAFAELQGRKIPYGIVSNSKTDFLKKVVQTHRLRLDFILGRENYKKPKPDPEPYIKGAAAAGLTYKDYNSILVFEDSYHGIKSASNAKMRAIGLTSQHTAHDLLTAGAVETCSSLADALYQGYLSDNFLSTLD